MSLPLPQGVPPCPMTQAPRILVVDEPAEADIAFAAGTVLGGLVGLLLGGGLGVLLGLLLWGRS